MIRGPRRPRPFPIAPIVACVAACGSAPRLIAISDVTIVDVEHGRKIGPSNVLIEEQRIVAITPAGVQLPRGTQRVDGRGRFLIPGMVDMHVHLFNLASRRPPNDWAFPLFVANGVTAVREMNSDPAALAIVARWRTARDRGELLAPRILAAGVAVGGASPADGVAIAAAARADFVKVFSELDAAQWHGVIDAARAHGLPVAGHVPAGVSLLEAAHAGQRTSEHLMQAYEACSRLEAEVLLARTGLAGAALVTQRDADEARVLATFDAQTCVAVATALAATDQAQVPTLVLAETEAATGAPPPADDPRWPYLRSDEQARWQRLLASSPPDALADLRWEVSRRIVATFHRAGVLILAGTDAPMPRIYPGFALHDELECLVAAGLSPLEALRAATLAPAQFLGLAATSGRIAVGTRADLVLLDADPTVDIRAVRRIRAVVLAGRLLERAELDAVLAAARANASGANDAHSPTSVRPKHAHAR